MTPPPDACPLLPSRALWAWARTELARTAWWPVLRDWARWKAGQVRHTTPEETR